jgi:hypothetical protein
MLPVRFRLARAFSRLRSIRQLTAPDKLML